MKDLIKQTPRALLLGAALVALPSCQSPSANSSSVIEETASDTAQTDCQIFKPQSVSENQFDFTSSEKDGFWTQVRLQFGDETVDEETQWVRDYMELEAEIWLDECIGGG